MQSVLRDPPPEALAMELGDSSVQMRFLAWVDQREHGLGKVRSEAIRLVKLALEDSGVDLPSPEFKVVLQERLSDEAQPSELPTDSGGPTRPRGPRQERDTASEDAVDEQIREDQRISGEENLLVGTSGPDLGDE
jgi:small conductance mechanosensitive channel